LKDVGTVVIRGDAEEVAQRVGMGTIVLPEKTLAWVITRIRDCSSFGKSALGHTAAISLGAKPHLGEAGES
jgi:hypothetical protein